MRYLKSLILLIIFSFISLIAPQRMLFWEEIWSSDIWDYLAEPAIGGAVDLVWTYLQPTSPSQDQAALLNEIRSQTGLLEQIKDSITDLPTQITNLLKEEDLYDTFDEIEGLWQDMTSVLLTYNSGEYKNEEIYQDNARSVKERIRDNISVKITEVDFNSKIRDYLDKIIKQLLENKTDSTTYTAKVSVAIKDVGTRLCQLIDLLKFGSDFAPQLARRVDELLDDLKSLKAYQEEHLSGSWFNLSKDLLEKEEEIDLNGKAIQIFNSLSHFVHGPDSPSLGAGNAYVTPLRIASASGANFGNETVILQYEISAHVWKDLCASGDPLGVKFDCEDEELRKWRLTPCSSNLPGKKANLDFLCIIHVASNLSLTFQPSTENLGSLAVKEFDANNNNQLFNLTDVRRCCQVFSKPDFDGKTKEICFSLTEAFSDNLAVPKGFESVASARCSADIRLVMFEEKDYSGREVGVAAGTEMSSIDPNIATQIRSFLAISTAARIFTDPNKAGQDTAIYASVPDFGDKFVDKNPSILLAEKFIEFFELPNYQGRSIVVRRSTNLNLPFTVRSARVME